MKKLLIIILLSGTTLSQLNAGEYENYNLSHLGFEEIPPPYKPIPPMYEGKKVGPITEEAHNKNEAIKELTAGYNALLVGDFKNVPSHSEVEQFLSKIGKQQEPSCSVSERRRRTEPTHEEPDFLYLYPGVSDFYYSKNFEIALKTFEDNDLIKKFNNKFKAIEVADVYFSGWHPHNASHHKALQSNRVSLAVAVCSLWATKQEQEAKELNKTAAEGTSTKPSSAEFKQVARKLQPSGAAALETSTEQQLRTKK